jgi:hypothetical protein
MKIHPTRFTGYYVSEDGKVYTEWYTKNIKGIKGARSVRGPLKELNQFPRGGGNPEDRYLSVNISLKDENERTIKQIQYYVHRLIAETFIDNQNNCKEVDHNDREKKKNYTSKNIVFCTQI